MVEETKPGAEVSAPTPHSTTLRELALVFLRLGCISFGGPAGHIAMMEDDLVRRRRWLSHETFLDRLGAVNLLPGPNSTEMALYIGLLRGGWAGLLVAGVSFVLPAAVMVASLAWVYVRAGAVPQVVGVLYGVKPVVIAVVVQALWRLGHTAVKTKFLGVLGAVALVVGFLGVNPILLLFLAGLIGAIRRWFAKPSAQRSPVAVLLPAAGVALGKAGIAAVGLWPLFLYFLKVGAVLFGSGYLLLAFLRADLVERWHWLTESQLLDAIAVSQVTPGPLSTAATFIGYFLAGPWGALVATVGIFLPGFVAVAASGKLVPRLRESPIAGAFLDGVNVGALAMMSTVSWQLRGAAVVDWTTAIIALASAALLFRFRVNSVWLVLGGALVGLGASALRERF